MVGAILVGVGSPGGAVAGSAPLQIRIVVVTTFPQGYLSPRYNTRDHVLGLPPAPARPVPAASIMVLGLDPRFDLSQAHWILDGIASINLNRASVRSAAGASHRVDGDLVYEIDGREIPADWPTIVPYDRATPSSTRSHRPPATMPFWPTT
jgi:purine nucleoside permease